VSGQHIPMSRRGRCLGGFSLIEVMIALTILGIALLGLAELFVISLANNKRGGEISTATFLAQQQVNYLRGLTAAELNAFPSSSRGESDDESVNINSDAEADYRRVTQVQVSGYSYAVKVLVFPASQIGVPKSTLLQDPNSYRVRAVMSTVISR